MSALQLEFWKNEEECEIAQMRTMCNETRGSLDKVRKKLFAENGSLKLQLLEISERLNIIERHICKK